MQNNSIVRIISLLFALNFITSHLNAQSIESSISRGLNNSNSLSGASLEWASLKEKLNQSSAGKEITGTLQGSFSETYSGNSGDYNNSFSNSITATLSKKLYDGGVAKSSEKINNLRLSQKSIQIKFFLYSVNYRKF